MVPQRINHYALTCCDHGSDGHPNAVTVSVDADAPCSAHIKALALLLLGASYESRTIAEAMREWADECDFMYGSKP
jgi:hypothetical protein